MKFVLYLLLFMSFAHAQKAKVLLIDENINGKELEKNFDVEKNTHQSSIPNKADRDLLLKNVKGTAKWDELQKDIFYMDLKSKSVKELKKKYSEFSEKELQLLKDKR
ncbi:hypothetical protein [Peredibacter starrii]|uniref:Uncharacterized protein n=1 Tax=Peredibacter starrii TaxID=28202 RepID=A0AAX4HNM8_9BACT|nr:hypothetical protein [Peredibacter starrii]WPU64864.1 hypothetical protein SOO65_19400 [Peredibacter starrii]